MCFECEHTRRTSWESFKLEWDLHMPSGVEGNSFLPEIEFAIKAYQCLWSAHRREPQRASTHFLPVFGSKLDLIFVKFAHVPEVFFAVFLLLLHFVTNFKKTSQGLQTDWGNNIWTSMMAMKERKPLFDSVMSLLNLNSLRVLEPWTRTRRMEIRQDVSQSKTRSLSVSVCCFSRTSLHHYSLTSLGRDHALMTTFSLTNNQDMLGFQKCVQK